MGYPPPAETAAEQKDFRRRVYTVLARDYDVDVLRFMNYGFVPEEGSGSKLDLNPEEEKFRCHIQLYHHLASKVVLEGKRVLEVGCGRGGGAAYVARCLRPALYVGVDLTLGALQYGAAKNDLANLRFLAGDAERLPFQEETFDVVLNVESCHCYEPIELFLAGVKRVLTPGGYLLLTDFRGLVKLDELRRSLFASGLILREEIDISKNVLQALKQESRGRMQTIVNHAKPDLWPLLQEFGAVRGSIFFQELEGGGAKYLTYVLQKPA